LTATPFLAMLQGMDEKTLTVKELIEVLKQFPPDLPHDPNP
jgi:hypothetical protein